MIKNKKKTLIIIGAAAFWLVVWEIASLIVGSKLLLTGPTDVVMAFAGMIITRDFWLAAGQSMLRIMLGFIFGLLAGTALGALSARFTWSKTLLSPIISVIKAAPVASFVILALFWMGSDKLSTFSAFLIALPIIYINTLQGLQNREEQLAEMAAVFRMKRRFQAMYLYIPAVRPFIISAGTLALGMCWKSGVAAEVIGLQSGTLGEQLYYSKLYLNMADLAAYTAAIIIFSRCFEWLYDRFMPLLLTSKPKNKTNDNAVSLPQKLPVKDNSYHGIKPLTIKNLTKRFGEKAVFEGLSLELPAHCAVLGESGCGKTTLLRIIAGLEKPDGGELNQAEKPIAFCFQENRLFTEQSALNNLRAVMKRYDKAAALSLLGGLGLTASDISKPVSQLSGGQARRVALARALIADAKTVVLDEPFTGLDEANKDKAAATICAFAADKRLILALHSRQDALKVTGDVIELGGD
jgi:NitT/TauT family transport system permease protein